MDLAPARIPKNVKNGQMVTHGDDSTVLATFSDEYIQNEFQSGVQGKVVYDHFYQVTLEYPGNNLSNFIYRFRPEEAATSQWTERFPRQWEAFRNQQTQIPEGTPIELWPPIGKGRVLELKAMKIHTVEQIAGLTDMTGPNIGMDWRKLRDMAKTTTEPNEALAQVARVTTENEAMKNQIEIMQRQISEMAQGNDEAKKRGPKPKQVA